MQLHKIKKKQKKKKAKNILTCSSDQQSQDSGFTARPAFPQ